MTETEFRKLALTFPETEEKSHFGKADFRVKNKIFATLLDASAGVVKLLPEQQNMIVASEPNIFSPIKGGWGNQGWTRIQLGLIDLITAKSALNMAWRNVAPKALQRVGTGVSPR